MNKLETKQIEKSPLISVIIPLYNYEKYVLNCIESIEYEHAVQ